MGMEVGIVTVTKRIIVMVTAKTRKQKKIRRR